MTRSSITSKLKIFLVCISLGSLLISVTGCTSTQKAISEAQAPTNSPTIGVVAGAATGAAALTIATGGIGAIALGTVGGALIGGGIGLAVNKYMRSHEGTRSNLRLNGIQTFTLGDKLVIVLSSDRFFEDHSPVINFSYYQLLNSIGVYLRNHKTMSVNVAAYTDNVKDPHNSLLLSTAQASKVMQVLNDVGLDTRFTYSKGYGSKDPISSNSTKFGRMENNRIIITAQLPGPTLSVNNSQKKTSATDNYVKEHSLVREQMVANGSKSFILGNHMVTMLSSNYFFMKNSAHINPKSYLALNKIGMLLRKYDIISIHIAGYADNQGTEKENLVLSQAQANEIMDIFDIVGIGARFITATGYGDKNPVASNHSFEGRSENQRIVIDAELGQAIT